MKLNNVKNYLRRDIRPKKILLTHNNIIEEQSESLPNPNSRKSIKRSKVIDFLPNKRFTNQVALAKVVQISKREMKMNFEENIELFSKLKTNLINKDKLNFNLIELDSENKFSNMFEIKTRTNEFNLSLFFFTKYLIFKSSDYEFALNAYENEKEKEKNSKKDIFRKQKKMNKDEDIEKPEMVIPIIIVINKTTSDNSGLVVLGLKRRNFVEYTRIGFTSDISYAYKKIKAGENIINDERYCDQIVSYSRIKHFMNSEFRNFLNDFKITPQMLDVIEYCSMIKNRILFKNWLENVKDLFI